jgi:membrane protein required for colicin V production
MVEAQFNMFDAIVLLVLLLSTLLAFFRGFVREVLSLGAWVGAAVITLFAFPTVSEMLKEHTTQPMVAYLIGGVGVYMGALLIISIINMVIMRYVKSGSEVGMLDNFLGLMFGGLRGAFIVSLAYLLLSNVIDENNPPEWLKQAQTQPYAKQGAELLASVAPGYMQEMADMGETIRKKGEERAAEMNSTKGEFKLPDFSDVERLSPYDRERMGENFN